MKSSVRAVRVSLVIGILATLCCCDGSIAVLIRTSEVLAVAQSQQLVKRIPVSIAVNNLDSEDDIIFLKEILHCPSDARKEKAGDAEPYCFDVQIPLVSGLSGEAVRMDDLFEITVTDTGSAFELRYTYNMDVLGKIQLYFYEKYQVAVDPGDFNIRVGIRNDTAKRMAISGRSIYVGGRAYPFDYGANIDSDELVEFELSDVLIKALASSENGIEIASIGK